MLRVKEISSDLKAGVHLRVFVDPPTPVLLPSSFPALHRLLAAPPSASLASMHQLVEFNKDVEEFRGKIKSPCLCETNITDAVYARVAALRPYIYQTPTSYFTIMYGG